MMEAPALIFWLAVVVATCCCDQSNVDEYVEQNKILRYSYKKKYRPAFHISAPLGWLNAPAGFVFFRKQFHIFFQYYPYNGAWDPMRWGHITSRNLIDWVYSTPALVPREYYEIHGCFSGSAVVQGHHLKLFYTGVTTLLNKTSRTQNIATSTDGVYFEKHLYNPVIKTPTEDSRNPKVWQYRDRWYMALAATSAKGVPKITMYRSEDLFTWKYNGTILESLGDMGNLWEHPDFFELDGQHVLIFTVNGLAPDIDRFKNLYQTGYVVGKFNYQDVKFEDVEISLQTFNELDYGHDFYGAQSLQALDGRRLLVGWLGMWQSDFEELRDGWAGMLSLFREVTFGSNDRLLMRPLKELEQLRVDLLENTYYHPGETFQAGTKYFELMANASSVTHDVGITFSCGGKRELHVRYAASRGQVFIDRGGEDGVRKASWTPERQVFLRMYMDSSSVELFCGEGEVVFSSRFYPKRGMKIKIEGDQSVHIVQYKLRRNVAQSEHLRAHLRELHELAAQGYRGKKRVFPYCPHHP